MRLLIISFLMLMTSWASLSAQQHPPRLYINQTRVMDNVIEIDYDITYGGFVELHLFDQSGKKIWIKGVVNQKLGSFTFKIPTRPLKAGERYTYFFRYKGDEYNGSFYAS